MTDRLPDWTRTRPATTVLSTPRISAPRALDRDPDWRPGDRWQSQFKNAARISVEDAAILQGFRPDYPWLGSRHRCFLQIGNAVCPPLARLVIEAAARFSLSPQGRER